MRPELAVGAVCLQDGRLLLIQRAHAPGAGRWSLPGGRVERGEHLAIALAREVLEETGLHVRVAELCGFAERIGGDYHYVILDFWAAVHGGELVPGDDASAVAWVGARELQALPLVDGLMHWLTTHAVLERLSD